MTAPELLTDLRAKVAELRNWFGLAGVPAEAPACLEDHVAVMLAAVEAVLERCQDTMPIEEEPEDEMTLEPEYVMAEEVLLAFAYGPDGRGGLLGTESAMSEKSKPKEV